ncbi:hypothetical protein OAV27_01605 [Euryarchaeota archaeon]|nr:hypothetical protein [Euryarchaeota archaeon]
MAGIWPFKKKAAEAEKQKIVKYSKDDNHAEEIMADRSHIEDDQYQAALDLLTTPHLGEVSSGEVAKSEVVATKKNEETVDLLDVVSAGTTKDNYEQSGDGYWYLKKDDGSFDPTAYVKADDGSFNPYSE